MSLEDICCGKGRHICSHMYEVLQLVFKVACMAVENTIVRLFFQPLKDVSQPRFTVPSPLQHQE